MLLHLPLPPFPFSTFSSTMKPSVLSAAFLLTLLCPCTLWTAWSRKIVEYLPGFDGPLPFYLETGYIEVDEEQGANLFYHFVKSEKNPEEDPLIFHIDGGPGCSLFNGFALQIGPVRFDVDSYDGGSTPKLVHWPETWTTFSSIIFVDWPVGTGYSFARGDMMDAWSDTKGSELLYVFIKEWALEHPEFASNPFYLSGMSFGGKMVPIVVQKIIDGNEAGETPFFNLKGYLAGNPITTDARYDEDTKVDFARGMGLISDELYKDIKKTCGDNMGFAENPTCMKYLNAFQKNLAGIHPSNILDPACGLDDPLSRRSIYTERYELEIEKSSLSSLLVSKKQCREYVYILSKIWSDNVAVQEALGVSKEWRGNWLRCNHYIKQEFSFDIPSPVPYYFNITNKGIRGLVYSGDHDLKANFIGTQAWMSTFDFPITSEWRSWKAIGQVSGYTRSYAGKLSYATVKAAGHVAPIYKPKECKVMVERWILGEVL